MSFFNSIRSNPNKPLKLVVLGEGGVGKTTIAKTFVNNRFYSEATQTIAVEFHSKIFSIGIGTNTKIQIWDLGGQEQFKNMRTVFRKFCEGADGALLCFDLTDIGSLFAIPEWLEFLENDAQRFLIGTKYDIAIFEERNINLETFQQKFNCEYSFKCTAKDVNSIENIFKQIIISIRNYKEKQLEGLSEKVIERPKWMDYIPTYHKEFG
ncbi:MAG: Rab family GTPase [Promethearchaeota archaeon]